jgi:hypothetical protein
VSYEKLISRKEPGVVVFVLDDSFSMGELLPGTSDPKFTWVERYGGHLLEEMLARSTVPAGEQLVIKPRYFIYTIMYGGEARVWGDGLEDIQAVVERYAAAGRSFGLGGRISCTDTARAFQAAPAFLQTAVVDERFRTSFPPMVFHLTDGESQTNARPIAEQLGKLATADGNVLVVNAYIGTQTSLAYTGPADFPGYITPEEAGTNPYNLTLFDMSSEMPPCIRQNLVDDGIFPAIRPSARLFFDVRTKEMLKHVIQVVGSIGSRAAAPAAQASGVE